MGSINLKIHSINEIKLNLFLFLEIKSIFWNSLEKFLLNYGIRRNLSNKFIY
jgi:hypothetical protein